MCECMCLFLEMTDIKILFNLIPLPCFRTSIRFTIFLIEMRTYWQTNGRTSDKWKPHLKLHISGIYHLLKNIYVDILICMLKKYFNPNFCLRFTLFRYIFYFINYCSLHDNYTLIHFFFSNYKRLTVNLIFSKCIL